MWLSLIVPTAYATLGFANSWKETIKGDSEIQYSYNQQHFKAHLTDDLAHPIELNVVDNKLKINALPQRIWCLLFNEGQLMYPSPSQHGHEALIEVDEGMEVVVVIFDNTPGIITGRLGTVDKPMTMEEFTTLSKSWFGCSLFKGGFTPNPSPFFSVLQMPLTRRCCMHSVVVLIFIILAMGVFSMPLWMTLLINDEARRSMHPPPNDAKWLDVWCNLEHGKHLEFSNLNLNTTDEWRQEMIEFCLNSNITNCKILTARKPFSKDCGFTGN